MGDLGVWRRQAERLREAAEASPASTRDGRALWRGKCQSNERKGVDPRRQRCHFRKGAGNRARLLAAALTASRPDIFDAKRDD